MLINEIPLKQTVNSTDQDYNRELTRHIVTALSYDDILLIPKFSTLTSRSEADISAQITPNIRLRTPVISSNMDTVTGVAMALKLADLGGIGILPRFDSVNDHAQKVFEVKEQGRVVGAALGCKPGFIERAQALISAGVDVLVLDVAHGHMQQALEATTELKNSFNNIALVCGNVATYEGTKDLFNAGADSVKVGIGPASICTTRVETGCGVPQITAVLEASRAAREMKKTIICDGGIKSAGDIVKGLAAGASAVMLGNMLAGTDEAPGDIVVSQGDKSVYVLKFFGLSLLEIVAKGQAKKFKRYNGSTSQTEKIKQVNKDKSDKGESYTIHVEGVEGLVSYKGPVEYVVKKLMAGVKSGFSYNGARNLEELWANADFVQITPAGEKESKSHSII